MHARAGLLLLALGPSWSACVIEVDCLDHADCGGGEFCWDRTCEPATDRPWSVEIVAAEVDWLHPDGAGWDTDGSPPDLYVEFGPATDLCATSYWPDEVAPVWYEACDFYVPGATPFQVSLWDIDGTVDELGASWTFDDFTALARTAGEEVAMVDESGTVTTWMTLWPLYW